MRDWTPERVAAAAGARLVNPVAGVAGPARVVIDSREAGEGDLFVGLQGANVDGGAHAPAALAAGAWGALVADEHAEAARCAAPGVLLAAEDPLAALQALAREWRRELGARVIGITGSTGKTSTKELLAALLAPHRATYSSRANYNTEIGLPLAVLEAPEATEVLVLELAMRGAGQIAELAAVCEPDVGVVVNVGPAHLELLGSLEAIAAAKAELIVALPPGGTVVAPAGEALLEPHRRDDVDWVTFGDGGDVSLRALDGDRATIAAGEEELVLELPFTHAHQVLNALAAVAAARAVGVTPAGRVSLELAEGRGAEVELAWDGGTVLVVDDCYNANPMSMRAALDHLATSARGRRVAVLGDMLELGPREVEFHEEVGRQAAAAGVEVLVTVGPRAAAMADAFDGQVHSVADADEAAALVPELVEAGDVVLVKASRGVALEAVAAALRAEAQG